MWVLVGGLLLQATLCLAAYLGGVRSVAARGWHWLGVALAVAVGGLVALLLSGGAETGGGVAEGVWLGALLVGAVPQLAYHWLGYWMRRALGRSRPVALVAFWIATLPLSLPYSVFALLWAYATVRCGAGQADCPFG
jgi:hypothetical protein